MSNLYWLSDAQMTKLEPFFPKFHGKPRVDVFPYFRREPRKIIREAS